SPKYEAELSLLGGRLLHYRLVEHKKELGGEELLDLVTSNGTLGYPLGLSWSGISDNDVAYTVSGATTGISRNGNTFSLKEGEELRLVLEGQSTQDPRTITKTFIFRPDSNLLGLEAHLSEPTQDGSKLSLSWTTTIHPESLNSRYNPPQVQWFSASNDVERLSLLNLQESEKKPDLSKWISIGDKYFAATITSEQETDLAKAAYRQVNENYLVSLSGEQQDGNFEVYIGPKKYRTLEKLKHELRRTVDLGFFSFLSLPLLTLIHLFYDIIGNYGLAIILLTLLIKTVFLPLNVISFRSMRAMQQLQPEIKALRERVKDPTQLNQEMMALYKKRGVNPMGGCLPMLIQIPVFFGLYTALLNSVDLRHAPFALWITDLSAPERLHMFGVGVPVMLLLMGASMMLQQYLTPSAMDPQQKKIMMLMPIVFTVMFIIFPFPSGLVLYWLVNNSISIVQQTYLRSEKGIHPLRPTVLASVGILGFGWFLTQI
ncbi:MAG: membrane protein insertase YidC, partial [Bdellovibrionales bacterium]|nr:membrane protein insertase YidC [Bdellovibrionales bacterium]